VRAYDGLLFALSLAERVWRFERWAPAALALAIVLIAAAWLLRRAWLHWLAGAAFLAASAVYSIWVLAFGWLLAALGFLMALAGALWRWRDKDAKPAHPSGSLIWPGLGLLLAPVANIFLLMPLLRPYL
jgi:hypothetical protein